jgi:hypothetical protein
MNIGFQVFISIALSATSSGATWPVLTSMTEPIEAIFSMADFNMADFNMADFNMADSAPAELDEVAEEDTARTESLTFACQVSEGVPTTIAQTPAATVPIVQWNSAAIALETNPQTDCEASAERFQAAFDEGLLSYITTGRMSGQLVMCTADSLNGGCQNRLLTLRPTPKPRLALQRVLQIPLPTDGPISDTDCRAYVELNRYLAGDYTGEEDICPDEDS